ncbi:hypothetical protein D1AOALGA4SA_4169 [Olavius algarvensis Delta 1 endosymbiont]|nr:hypothetical protein D1AOALGA4SA_4169 [Olavius algarvensis Delta 1 endosymbiont]
MALICVKHEQIDSTPGTAACQTISRGPVFALRATPRHAEDGGQKIRR